MAFAGANKAATESKRQFDVLVFVGGIEVTDNSAT